MDNLPFFVVEPFPNHPKLLQFADQADYSNTRKKTAVVMDGGDDDLFAVFDGGEEDEQKPLPAAPAKSEKKVQILIDPYFSD